jgi:hypothetical protein
LVARDHNGQQLAYIYFGEEPQRPSWSLLGSIALYHPPLAAEAPTIARYRGIVA